MEAKDLINLRMLGHPVNWAIVWTTLLFAAFAYHFVQERVTARPASTA
jgi:hypothetical protein